MVILSIIIPVYNVERYLRRCLDSVFSQIGEKLNYEVIVVNDGSPDNSQAIIDEYAQSHTNMFVINQSNKGLSSARNAGLKQASGKYVWFVDSDDSISIYSVSLLTKQIEQDNCDVYVFSMIRKYELDGKQIKSYDTFVAKKFFKYYNRIDNGSFYNGKLHIGAVQKNIFSRNFLNDNNLIFMDGIYHEDIDFFIRVLIFAKKIKPLDEHLYYYLIRNDGSITSSRLTQKHVNDRLNIIHNLKEMRINNDLSKQQLAIVNDSLFHLSYNLLFDKKIQDDNHLSEYINQRKTDIINDALISFVRSITTYFSLGRIFRFVKIIFQYF